jgi:formamidopyrimidine-DNA glycosylase
VVSGIGNIYVDSLYVNVNGESGYVDRSLDAYGREGEPCRRYGAVMRREKFMNRRRSTARNANRGHGSDVRSGE